MSIIPKLNKNEVRFNSLLNEQPLYEGTLKYHFTFHDHDFINALLKSNKLISREFLEEYASNTHNLFLFIHFRLFDFIEQFDKIDQSFVYSMIVKKYVDINNLTLKIKICRSPLEFMMVCLIQRLTDICSNSWYKFIHKNDVKVRND